MTLIIINTIVFYAVNWIFLMLIVIKLYKIRHIKDKLDVRNEMAYTIAVWTFFSLIQYFFFLCD